MPTPFCAQLPAEVDDSTAAGGQPMGISEIISTHREAILAAAARHGVTSIKVFGSVARSDARDDNDVDFLVEVGPKHSACFPAVWWRTSRKSSDGAWTSSSRTACTHS